MFVWCRNTFWKHILYRGLPPYEKQDWQNRHLSNAYEGMLVPCSYTQSVITLKLYCNHLLNYHSCTCASLYSFGVYLKDGNRYVVCMCGIFSGKLTVSLWLLQTEEASSMNVTLVLYWVRQCTCNTWKVILQESIVQSTHVILFSSQLKRAYE